MLPQITNLIMNLNKPNLNLRTLLSRFKAFLPLLNNYFQNFTVQVNRIRFIDLLIVDSTDLKVMTSGSSVYVILTLHICSNHNNFFYQNKILKTTKQLYK